MLAARLRLSLKSADLSTCIASASSWMDMYMRPTRTSGWATSSAVSRQPAS